MGQQSSLYRTVEILRRLNEGKRICISNIASEFDVSIRTVRRDMALIREIFGDFASKEKECYQAYKKILLDDVLNARDLMTLANIVMLFGLVNQNSLVSGQTKALMAHAMDVYDFRTRPFEYIKNPQILKYLEHAIRYHKEIRIRYQSDKASTYANFKPYKILFLNENFYLVGENSSKGHFELRRINLIESIELKNHTFLPDASIKEFIQTIQTPWANFKQSQKHIKIRVDSHIKRFFVLKKYLPSQNIIKTFENGDILVEYYVTNYHEIEELLIKWLPDIKIISPPNLKKMLRKRLKKKLDRLQ
jgi:predicted DNA-binding transcriptional regulator YafY